MLFSVSNQNISTSKLKKVGKFRVENRGYVDGKYKGTWKRLKFVFQKEDGTYVCRHAGAWVEVKFDSDGVPYHIAHAKSIPMYTGKDLFGKGGQK